MNFKNWAAFLILATILVRVASAGANEGNTSEPQEARGDSKSASKPAEVERISVDELKEMIAESLPVTVVDARSAGSYDSSDAKIKGAIRIPLDEIALRLKELPRDKEIVVYCA
jgi:3-mercaptopyruvate sulfurtransferase SseA